MKIQDKYYLEKEGDDFFSRNFEGHKAPNLRENKKTILSCIENSKINFDSVIEFGCNYGDLLNYFSTVLDKQCVGIEASNKAVEYGRKLYSDAVEFHHGIIADNPVSNDASKDSLFDLAIVDDVFSWVSRNSILASIANVDKSIKDGGFLFIRDFSPHKFTKNLNHHVKSADVFNFKVVGSHSKILMQTGMYEIVAENIYYDRSMSAGYKCDNPFNYRWSDVILQKKTTEYFDDVTKV
jgi:cyclopropane fatty-acyl-phospholipid synthase-like methyltransferase